MKIETIWKYLRINDIERTYYFIIELFVNLLVTSLRDFVFYHITVISFSSCYFIKLLSYYCCRIIIFFLNIK
jgi:hypothetical protein